MFVLLMYTDIEKFFSLTYWLAKLFERPS